MAEAKSPAKNSAKALEKSTGRSAALHATPPLEAVATADLSKIIEELQKRLSQVEKRSTTASPRRRKAGTEAAPAPAASAIPEPTLGNPDAVESRLGQLRDLEHAMHLEEIALYTRAKAAAQEEMLIRQESQTLRLKLRSFRAMAQRLCEQEALLAQGLAELESQRRQLEQERAAFEQSRQQLEAVREKLEADRAALTQFKSRPSEKEMPADASPAVSTADAPASPRSGSLRSITLTTLALTLAIGLCVTLAWLTITPVYRASATVAGLSVDDAALAHGSTDHSSWLADTMLQESMNTLEARGRRPFADVTAMRQALTQAMMLFRNDDGSIEVVYDSPHRNEAVFVLDAVLRSVRKLGATETAGSLSIRITRAAAADLDPVRDGRIGGALSYFALLAGLVAVVHVLRHHRGRIYALMSFKKGSFSR